MKKILAFCAVNFLVSMVCVAQPQHTKIVVIAPHPDDAEASCGGLIANYTQAGDSVIILTMTGGELGIWGKNEEEARSIRSGEARNAAAKLGASVIFFGAIDASLSVDSTTTRLLTNILVQVNPDIVLAPWPLDVHSDHQASGLLAWRVFLNKQFTFELYFYETSNSPHTKSFQFVPTDYIDISGVIKKKQEALYCHKSQNPAEWWGMYEQMAIVHGYEVDIPLAEAYIKARPFSGMGGREGKAGKILIRVK
jgi:LmbE family N-acetylglucosaminyl deacetylase